MIPRKQTNKNAPKSKADEQSGRASTRAWLHIMNNSEPSDLREKKKKTPLSSVVQGLCSKWRGDEDRWRIGAVICQIEFMVFGLSPFNDPS